MIRKKKRNKKNRIYFFITEKKIISKKFFQFWFSFFSFSPKWLFERIYSGHIHARPSGPNFIFHTFLIPIGPI